MNHFTNNHFINQQLSDKNNFEAKNNLEINNTSKIYEKDNLLNFHQIIAHVDMDCFFAAVEERNNLKLKGKPVIIGASPRQKRGVVSTANYVARKYGIHSAMPISQAYKLCPHGIFIQSDYHKYKSTSQKIMQILSLFATRMEPLGIDEAFIDITSFAKETGDLKKAALKIKDTIYCSTGLTCSVGLASSRYVAKIASDYDKPNGITIVHDQKSFLEQMSVNKICGIGKATKEVLNKIGISTIGDLAKHDRFSLLDKFGEHIIHYQEIARGNDKTSLSEEEYQIKSVSKEITFQEDIFLDDCYEYIDQIMKYIMEGLGKLSYKTVSIKVRFSDFSTITRSISLDFLKFDEMSVISAASSLLSQVNDTRKIRLFGIKVSNLVLEKERQQYLDEFI
jgi:DNA polymerase IV (archaeal DinB-like DNA polymerase)